MIRFIPDWEFKLPINLFYILQSYIFVRLILCPFLYEYMHLETYLFFVHHLLFQMAEVHYLGQIASGTNFPENRLCVRFKVKIGSGWKLISG